MERAKCVLFDMDGVLIDSMPNHAVAWKCSMESFGITMSENDAYLTEGARGVDTIRKMVKEQHGRDIDEAEAQKMYDDKTRRFGQLPKPRTMPYAIELQEKLHSRGITIGVVTGSGQRPLISRLLKEFPRASEDRLVTAYDVERGKPLPDPYLSGMKKCGAVPSETIVIENAPLGVMAGVASGAFTVAVNTGPLPDSALIDAGADLIFNDLKEVYDAI